MEEKTKSKIDLHKLASKLVKTEMRHVAKDRNDMIVDGIDRKIAKHNRERKDRAFSFIQSLK